MRGLLVACVLWALPRPLRGDRLPDAWVVVVDDDAECVGALAVGASLVAQGTKGQLLALAGPVVSDAWVVSLERFGFEVLPIAARGTGVARSAFGAAFAHALGKFRRAVVVAPTTLAVARDVDALFDCACETCAVYDGVIEAAVPGAPVVVTPQAGGDRFDAAVLGRALTDCRYADPAVVALAPSEARYHTRSHCSTRQERGKVATLSSWRVMHT